MGNPSQIKNFGERFSSANAKVDGSNLKFSKKQTIVHSGHEGDEPKIITIDFVRKSRIKHPAFHPLLE